MVPASNYRLGHAFAFCFASSVFEEKRRGGLFYLFFEFAFDTAVLLSIHL